MDPTTAAAVSRVQHARDHLIEQTRDGTDPDAAAVTALTDAVGELLTHLTARDLLSQIPPAPRQGNPDPGE